MWKGVKSLDIGHYVYKYSLGGKVVYVGRTINMDVRIKQHAHDSHFKEFCVDNGIRYDEFDIDYISLGNSTEEDVTEKILINHYQPILNTKDTHDKKSETIKVGGNESCIFMFAPEWEEYGKNEKEKTLSNTYGRKEIGKKWIISSRNKLRNARRMISDFVFMHNLINYFETEQKRIDSKSIYNSNSKGEIINLGQIIDERISLKQLSQRFNGGFPIMSETMEIVERVGNRTGDYRSMKYLEIYVPLKFIYNRLPEMKYTANIMRKNIIKLIRYNESVICESDTLSRVISEFIEETEQFLDEYPIYQTTVNEDRMQKYFSWWADKHGLKTFPKNISPELDDYYDEESDILCRY